jgi:hypothetical protein
MPAASGLTTLVRLPVLFKSLAECTVVEVVASAAPPTVRGLANPTAPHCCLLAPLLHRGWSVTEASPCSTAATGVLLHSRSCRQSRTDATGHARRSANVSTASVLATPMGRHARPVRRAKGRVLSVFLVRAGHQASAQEHGFPFPIFLDKFKATEYSKFCTNFNSSQKNMKQISLSRS